MLPVGDHTMVIASVVAASYDPNLYDDNLLLRLDRTSPCVHMRQRKDPKGQTHFFLKPAGVMEVFVSYAQDLESHPLGGHRGAGAERNIRPQSTFHPASHQSEGSRGVDLR
jgi:hypothetical protein